MGPRFLAAAGAAGLAILTVWGITASFQGPFAAAPAAYVHPDPLNINGIDAGTASIGQLAVRGNAGVDGGLTVIGNINSGATGQFQDVNALGTVTAQDQTPYALTASGGLDITGGGRFGCTPGRLPGADCMTVAGTVSGTALRSNGRAPYVAVDAGTPEQACASGTATLNGAALGSVTFITPYAVAPECQCTSKGEALAVGCSASVTTLTITGATGLENDAISWSCCEAR